MAARFNADAQNARTAPRNPPERGSHSDHTHRRLSLGEEEKIDTLIRLTHKNPDTPDCADSDCRLETFDFGLWTGAKAG